MRPGQDIVYATNYDGNEDRCAEYRDRYRVGPAETCTAEYKQQIQQCQRGIQLADSRRFALYRSYKKIVNGGAADDNDVAENYDSRKPERNMLRVGKCNKRACDQQFVGDRIEQSAQPRMPVKTLGQVPVNPVRKARDEKQRQRPTEASLDYEQQYRCDESDSQ